MKTENNDDVAERSFDDDDVTLNVEDDAVSSASSERDESLNANDGKILNTIHLLIKRNASC